MNYLALLLLILAVFVLAFTLLKFRPKRKLRRDKYKDEYLKPKASQQETEVSTIRFSWKWFFQSQSERRRDYYRNEYLKSDAWKRKRYVVLKRDNWTCVYCGGRATQVHHKRYAKRNIGKEPIDWLVSICKSCHDSKHQ